MGSSVEQYKQLAARRGWKADVKPAVGERIPKQTMTKAEKTALEWLEAQGYEFVIPQPTRLFPLSGGGNYQPDFLAWGKDSPCISVIEVKGGYRGAGWEQGIERWKRVAAEYDCRILRFYKLDVDSKTRTIHVEAWKDYGDDGALARK